MGRLSNPKRGDRPKLVEEFGIQSLDDIIETWYLKNFILSKKIISDYISRNKIITGDEVKLFQIITKRLEKLNKIENLTYSDIYAWSAENIEIFNEFKLTQNGL